MGVFSAVTKNSLRIFRQEASRNGTGGGPRLVFVSHEATRTGAPMIILNILKHISTQTDLACQTILHNGGLLAEEFARHSTVECLNLPRKDSPDLKKRIRKVLARTGQPLLAFCNSMESRFIASQLAQCGVPIIFLIHELPSSYTEDDYRLVYSISSRIIFPVQTVADAANAKVPLPPGKAMVLPQGLLNAKFGSGVTREQARGQVCQELGLPRDTFLVLGCGTLDLRKGIDHFANIARRMLNTVRLPQSVHFVWVGDGPRWTHSTYHYVMLDLEKSQANSHVHFIGERNNVEPYFVAADAFLMTSRVDPFPCVIHEAMAVGLPIVAFDRSGGAPEAVSDGAGVVIDYADYEQATNVLCMLATQPAIAENIRCRSKERVQTEYRFDQYAQRLLELGETTVGKRLQGGIMPSMLVNQYRAA